jgi:hypothetical protein
VVVVVSECVSQLKPVFPANLKAVHNTEGLKQPDGSVNAGMIDILAALGEFMDTLGFLILERGKYGLAGDG